MLINNETGPEINNNTKEYKEQPKFEELSKKHPEFDKQVEKMYYKMVRALALLLGSDENSFNNKNNKCEVVKKISVAVKYGNDNNIYITKVGDSDNKEKKIQAPLPRYLFDNFETELMSDGSIRISGDCHFPDSDDTLKDREQANHFHGVRLTDNVVFALNVVWNSARIVAQETGWKSMVSIESLTYADEPVEKDKIHKLYGYLEPLKGSINRVTLVIKNEEGIPLFMVKTLVYIKKTDLNS